MESWKQVPVNEQFDVFYNTTRVFILICFILIWIPIISIFYQFCCGSNGTNKKNHIQSRIILSISIIFYVLFIGVTTYHTIAQYINFDLINISICKYIIYGSTGWLFIIAKALLYNYFILRINDTFYNTIYQFNTYLIQLMLPIELIVVFLMMFPVSYWITITDETQYNTKYDIQITPYHGRICILYISQYVYNGVIIAFSVAQFVEFIFSILVVGILLYKLIVIIQQTANDDYQYEAYEAYEASINYNTINTINTVETSNTDINADEIIIFHVETAKNNAILLLITKLLTLLIVQLICIIASNIFMIFAKMVFFGYIIDGIVDIYCLFLTFKFSEKTYYEYFGGKQCTKLCFPFIKMIAVSIRCVCCDFFIDHGNFGDFNKKIFKQKCKCICCLFCCTRCFQMKSSKKKQIFKMAKSEIHLLLATKLQHKKRIDHDVWNEFNT